MDSVRIVKTKDGATLPTRFNLYLSNFEFQVLFGCLEYVMDNKDKPSSFQEVEINCVRRLITEFVRADS